MSQKLKLNMEFSGSKQLAPVDLHKEITRKNLRFEKSKTLANQGVDSMWTDSNNPNSKDEQLIVNNQQLFGGANNSASIVDWVSWLPFAAKQYNISPNIRDYVVIPIPTIVTDLPNRNGVGFPLKELVTFRPHLGMQSYKTWKGKPTFEEHANDDHTVAKGVILDTHMRKIPGMNVWRLMKLLAFDRTRDPQMCQEILDRKRNSYSMGAYLDGYTCSICHKPFGMCGHIPPTLDTKDVVFIPQGGNLLFKNVINPEGFETSSVKTPAFISALNDNVFDMSEILGDEVTESTVIQMANADSIRKFGNRG